MLLIFCFYIHYTHTDVIRLPLFLMLFLFIYPQSLVHPETCWPEMSLTPALLYLGPRPRVTFVSTGSGGSLCSPKRLGKRQFQETQSQFWTVSPQRHVIRSLCLLAMPMERVSHWLERKPQMVSYFGCINSSTKHLGPRPSLLCPFLLLSFSWNFSNAFLLSCQHFVFLSFWMSRLGVT